MTEPDAEEYNCEGCGESMVYGADHWLEEEWVIFT